MLQSCFNRASIVLQSFLKRTLFTGHFFLNCVITTGTITAGGEAGKTSGVGGGSGGSILIHTHALEGFGVIAVNGGSGNGAGGGGGGGRMAIYWQDREWWYGALTAFGGLSSLGGIGGPGSIYLEVSKLSYVDNVELAKQSNVTCVSNQLFTVLVLDR